MEDLAGVLVRDFGIHPQGKSAPMSSFKPSAVRGGATARSGAGDLFSGDNLRYSDPSPSKDSFFDAVPKPVYDGGFFDDMVGMRNPSLAVQDDIFGLSSALPKTTSSSSPYQDILGDFGRASPPNRTSSSSPPPLDDLLGGFGPPNRTSSPPLDDLLGGFGRQEADPEISGKQQEDELIPGFGGGKKKERSPVKPAAEDDPFGLFGTEGRRNSAPKIQPPKPYDPLHTSGRNGVPKQSQKPPARPKEDEYAWFTPPAGVTPPSGHVWHSDVSFIDELESFGMNNPHRSPNGHGSERRAYDIFDFDEMERAYPVFSSSVGKTQTTIVTEDDMSSIFGTPADAATGDYPEIIGDNADRRSARFKQDQQKRVRMATALAEKKARELEVLWEQEEKHKISEMVDAEIKRWAAGKEGNLRALLSSLQLVLWPGCGWQPVPLTDLITGSSVKKVHKKAQLCIHPDKVQQKGATIEQKYIAEKVFDILQEAGRKFSSEEGF